MVGFQHFRGGGPPCGSDVESTVMLADFVAGTVRCAELSRMCWDGALPRSDEGSCGAWTVFTALEWAVRIAASVAASPPCLDGANAGVGVATESLDPPSPASMRGEMPVWRGAAPVTALAPPAALGNGGMPVRVESVASAGDGSCGSTPSVYVVLGLLRALGEGASFDLSGLS
jgi:hypothetical protein